MKRANQRLTRAGASSAVAGARARIGRSDRRTNPDQPRPVQSMLDPSERRRLQLVPQGDRAQERVRPEEILDDRHAPATSPWSRRARMSSEVLGMAVGLVDRP